MVSKLDEWPSAGVVEKNPDRTLAKVIDNPDTNGPKYGYTIRGKNLSLGFENNTVMKESFLHNFVNNGLHFSFSSENIL